MSGQPRHSWKRQAALLAAWCSLRGTVQLLRPLTGLDGLGEQPVGTRHDGNQGGDAEDDSERSPRRDRAVCLRTVRHTQIVVDAFNLRITGHDALIPCPVVSGTAAGCPCHRLGV